MPTSISLKEFNSFQIKSFGKEIHFIKSEADLIPFYGRNPDEYYILGEGSNVLMMSEISKVILKNEIKGIEIIHDGPEDVTLRIGAGENWHQLVLWALANNYFGIENLSLIPGSVGAAPVQNIGAYGVEISEVFVRLEGIHLKEGKRMSLNKKACALGYRDSIFKHDLKDVFFISYVHLKLSKTPNPRFEYGDLKSNLNAAGILHPSPIDVSNAVISIRQSKLPDPKILGNSGSFFKNNLLTKNEFDALHERFPEMPFFKQENGTYKIPTAWLIESCGYKGKREGDVGCHEKQALVLVNYGSAKGEEVLAFSEKIVDAIEQRFGVQLEREVNVLS
ncbi:MAG: UDP-N-acetylmuramate dehydrogenase [Saprospiraceae bacterium]|nr:UDP-N-acetylmuramate dehydrogenase [Saprospiraceae bacterium]